MRVHVTQCLARMGFAHRVHALPDEEFELDIAINAMPGIVVAAGKLCGAQRQRTRALVENGVDEIGLVVNLISDLAYMWVDPRIDFEAREV